MKHFRKAIAILLFVLLATLSADAQQEEALEAYYFFSPACPRCDNVAPYIKELSKAISIRGFVYGKGNAEPLPFEVRKTNKRTLRRYDVYNFPTLALVKNNAVRQKFIGEQDIKDARVILSAFRKGAWSVSEVIGNKSRNTYTVTGWVISRGEYFHSPQFYLTDRQQTMLIKPWLPIESVRSPFRKKRPRLMSDVIEKPVFLEGTVTKIGDTLQFAVENELSFE